MISPVDAILAWLSEFPPGEKRAAFWLLAATLFDGAEMGSDHEALIQQWLKSEGPVYRAAGKALTFRAAFEYHFRQRFNGSGFWEIPESVFRKAIKDASQDPGSSAGEMVGAAWKARAQISQRQNQWVAIGERWDALLESSLQDHILRAWINSEVQRVVNA